MWQKKAFSYQGIIFSQISQMGMVAGRTWRRSIIRMFFLLLFVGPFGFRWRAIYGDAKYPEGYEIRGIDISHYQGDIDWELLQNAMIEKCPIRFILIKATEGTDRIDPKFKENFRQAKEYGFIRGAYHFWSNKSSARSQAYSFLNKCISAKTETFSPYLAIVAQAKGM